MRSGFIHPLWSPSGGVLTDNFPRDHYHHKGIWSPWTNTEFEGIHPKIPFFNFAPSQAGDWTIEPGRDYVFRYRFYVHEGEVSVDEANRLWYEFGEPPVARISR